MIFIDSHGLLKTHLKHSVNGHVAAVNERKILSNDPVCLNNEVYVYVKIRRQYMQ